MVRVSAVGEVNLRGVDDRCLVWRCGEVERVLVLEEDEGGALCVDLEDLFAVESKSEVKDVNKVVQLHGYGHP
jgi:hypothetical protein